MPLLKTICVRLFFFPNKKQCDYAFDPIVK